MSRQRAWMALAIGLLVAVTAGIGAIAWHGREQPEDCGPAIEARERQLAEPITSGDRTIAVLGDSYTQGTGLSGRGDAWPAALGERLGAEVVVDGVEATGYTTPGFCITAPFRYGQRLAADPPDAEAVVVQGGVNDALLGAPDEVAAAAGHLLAQLEAVPTVVVVGPPAVPAADAQEIGTIDAALRSTTEAAGRAYVPLLGAGIPLLDDGVHPTVAGQQRIAELVAAAIETAGATG